MCHMMTFLYHCCTATIYYILKGRTILVKGANFSNQTGSWVNQFGCCFGSWGTNLGVGGGKLGVASISHSLIQILKNHWSGWKKRFALSFEMKEDHIEGCLTEDRGRGWHASCVGKNWVRM